MNRRGSTRKVTGTALKDWPLPDPCDSESKEDRGRVLVVGGSRQIPGAALLAATAALRAGAGKLQIATCEDVAIALAIAMPEAKVIALRSGRRGEIASASDELLDAAEAADAVLIGPGVEPSRSSRRLVAAILKSSVGTVVLDAGALDGFSSHGDAAVVPVITPHLGEMASLTGTTAAAIERRAADVALEFAQSSGAIVVLKGATTHIATPDGGRWIHTRGSVGLGTSGSGDVLAGIITGLAARGAKPEQAAVWGVYLHGRAGAALTRRQGLVGYLAREISAEIPALL